MIRLAAPIALLALLASCTETGMGVGIGVGAGGGYVAPSVGTTVGGVRLGASTVVR
ncbi:MAG TPA: hypothetical protein PKD10_00610 [Paracoccaceae bacterium]|nr:hypothetical protein [Paracoccaceae bacterium]HMO73094.1 hypothetical protein [Paracoccaceae bacterium]